MTGSQTGKVAIVTGGSANLGKLFAESLASDGANVVVHYNSPRRADEAQGVVNDLKATGVEAIAHHVRPPCLRGECLCLGQEQQRAAEVSIGCGNVGPCDDRGERERFVQREQVAAGLRVSCQPRQQFVGPGRRGSFG